jgi:hypothetical protein
VEVEADPRRPREEVVEVVEVEADLHRPREEVMEVEADLPAAPETRSAPHGARKSLHPSH